MNVVQFPAKLRGFQIFKQSDSGKPGYLQELKMDPSGISVAMATVPEGGLLFPKNIAESILSTMVIVGMVGCSIVEFKGPSA